MRWLRVCFLVLTPGLLLAQNNAQNAGTSSTTSVADEVKAMREAIAQQQQQIAQQQQQMAQQQQEIDKLQKALDEKTAGTAHVEDAALHTNTPPVTATVMQDTEKPKESPLSFRIGGADFTPGGFVDFENIFRSTNTGNVTATSFGAIPYSNRVQGHLTEFRSTGQYSRFSLDVKTKFGANNVNGYIEADFNGNDATNVFVTSNPHTDRLRLYWLDLKRGKWEFLGGQTWGLQTPNRIGVSPKPSDVMVTIGEDAQTHVGLPYTRSAEFRVAWHPNDNFVWAVALQNPQQYSNGEVNFPAQFNAQLGVQIDNGSSTNGLPGAPNAFPDMITKLAYDTNPSGGKNFHVELGGLLTSAKITFLPTSANPTFQHDTKIGGSGLFGLVWGLSPKFRVVANGLYGEGNGRYIIGMGPQLVVAPVNFNGATCVPGGSPTGNCGAAISMVHSGTALGGLEWQARPKTILAAYYGGAYFQRNVVCDLTTTTTSIFNCAGHPIIGFGGVGSADTSNRAIQEGTLDWTQTFWRNPQYGAVLLVTQYSYVTRAPWFVANGAPKNAHLSMAYVSLRYVLP